VASKPRYARLRCHSARTAGASGGEPVPSIERLWGALQRENAGLSPERRVVVAADSHNRIAEDERDVVVGAIREVVEAARRR
jgi:hypothetical protein